VVGNPLLVPERAESWDAGLAWRADVHDLKVEFEWAHHLTRVRDLVLYERSSPRGARPVNIGRARLEGDEATVGFSCRGATLRMQAAWLATVDQSDIPFYRGRRLPQRADFQAGARFAWRGDGWLAALDLDYSGATFLDRFNRKPSPGRTLAGASLGRRIGRFDLLVEGRNLGDVHTEDVAGFPLPGRLLLLSITGDLTGGSPRP
jgi:outer membrane cobalamin receptor